MILPPRSSALLLCGALLLCPMSAPASPSVVEHRAVVAHQLPARAPGCFNYGGFILTLGGCR